MIKNKLIKKKLIKSKLQKNKTRKNKLIKDKLDSLDQKNDRDDLKYYEYLPFGVQISPDGSRPLLLLREKDGSQVLPVPISSIEAGVTLVQSNKVAPPSTPHKFTHLLLESLQIKIVSCFFSEIKGSHLYVRLNIQNHPSLTSFLARAEDVMSLCLHLQVPLFANKEIVHKSRVLSSEMDAISKGILNKPSLILKNHHYLM